MGLDESDSVTPLRGFWILVATGSFFWIAHVYADLLADRIKGHHRMGRHAIEAVMAREWPLLQSSFVLAVPLALGAVGAVSTQLAFDLAWLSGMAALVGWGVVFSRKEGHGLVGIVAAARSQRRGRAAHRRVQGDREVSANGQRDDRFASTHERDWRPR